MSIKQLGKSFKYAWHGVSIVFRSEQNFRLQLLAGVVVIIAALTLDFPIWKIITLLLIVVLVLVLELVNSIFERLVDAFHPRVGGVVREMKDIMAATVLLASVGAVVIGAILFWYPVRALVG